MLVSTDAEAARVGTDGYTDTHTHTQDNYRNPRACAPRVKYTLFTPLLLTYEFLCYVGIAHAFIVTHVHVANIQ